MDVVYFTLLLAFVAGVILIMYSAYNFHGSDLERENNESYYLDDDIENKLKAIDLSVADADNAIGELSNMSSSVFKELEDKYQDLLFLYNLLDEKKKNAKGSEPKDIKPMTTKNVDILIDDITKKRYNNPKLEGILKLKNAGMSVPEIARQLDMGQDEIRMILELGGIKERVAI